MTPTRSKFLAFVLNVVPGVGLFYWTNKARSFIYLLILIIGVVGGMGLAIVSSNGNPFLILTLFGAGLVWLVSTIHLLISFGQRPQYSEYYASNGVPVAPGSQLGPEGYPVMQNKVGEDSERFYTIILSFIPGLGHMHMGLMQRGLSFLISFFGIITMLLFLTGITRQIVFLLFLCVLPIIWLYSMFDAVRYIHRKQAGEVLVDRTVFDEWDSGREEGKRSKVLATLLSAFPGAGQMYLGMQKRGLQMMLLFLGSFYIIDVLRLSLFLFLIPVIWFYCFFDGLQLTSRYGLGSIEDRPLLGKMGNYQHWIGISLLLLGLYYIAMNLVIPVIERQFPDLYIQQYINDYLRPGIVSFILVFGGIKLLFGSKYKQANVDDTVSERGDLD